MSSSTIAKQQMTADEFWEYCHRPENRNRRLELIRGEVVEMAKPTRLHGIVCTRIARKLDEYAERVEVGYVTSNDAGLVLEETPGTVVGPDVAYYTDAETYEDVPPKWGDVPPVLAVEVQSPNDRAKQVMQKVVDYLARGVAVVWVINYEERFVTIYRNRQSPVIVNEDGELTSEELPGFSCPVAQLFRLPGEKSSPVTP